MGKFWLIAIFSIVSTTLGAPKILKDINNNYERNTSTMLFGKSGSKSFFLRTTDEYGSELWVEEGGVVSLVKDINPGTASSSPFNFRAATFSGTPGVYFLATTAANGTELWRSDGTEGGTSLVKDINPGPSSAFISGGFSPGMQVLDGTSNMWFGADDGTNGNEPWFTDGTLGGTSMVTNLNPGALGSSPREFFVFQSFFTIIMFSAETSAAGREPYVMAAGGMPSLVSNINPAAGSSNPYGFSFNAEETKIIFAATTAAQGTEPWQTNFTITGMVKDIGAGAIQVPFPFMAGLSTGNIFSRVDFGVGGFDTRVFKTDGTDGGTTELKSLDCLPGGFLGFIYSEFIKSFKVVNDKIVFSCLETSGSEQSAEPWVTDGTVAGTKQLRDIFPGETGSQFGDLFPGNNRVIMPSNDGEHGYEPWTTDGTDINLLTDFNPGEASSFDADQSLSGILSTSGTTFDSSILQLRRGRRSYAVLSDGVTNTELFDDSNTSKTLESAPADFTPLGDNLLFTAHDPKKDDELFISDGTKRGTRLLKNITKAGGSFGDDLVALPRRGIVLFHATTRDRGTELWVTNGTKRGTKLLKEIQAGGENGVDSIFPNIHRNKVYFVADDGTNGRELWVTNGRARGTKLVRDIAPGISTSDPSNFISFRGKGYFEADDGTNGYELWVVNGSNASLFADLNPGAGDGNPNNFTKMGNQMFFTASDGTNGNELWVTDGTTTRLVKDIYPGSSGSFPGDLTVSGNRLFFSADDGVNGDELWISDGTEAGTRLLADIFPGADDSEIDDMYPFPGKRVLFSAQSSDSNAELWIAGESGATLLKDIRVGAGSSYPTNFIKIPGRKRVYFTATTAEHGSELWVTNGKAGGTKLVADINPGTESSSVSQLAIFRDMLVFSANNGTKGREPWIIREP